MTDTNKRFKSGSEFLPFHPQASHVNADYRDGWNACYAIGIVDVPTTRQPAETSNTDNAIVANLLRLTDLTKHQARNVVGVLNAMSRAKAGLA